MRHRGTCTVSFLFRRMTSADDHEHVTQLATNGQRRRGFPETRQLREPSTGRGRPREPGACASSRESHTVAQRKRRFMVAANMQRERG